MELVLLDTDTWYVALEAKDSEFDLRILNLVSYVKWQLVILGHTFGKSLADYTHVDEDDVYLCTAWLARDAKIAEYALDAIEQVRAAFDAQSEITKLCLQSTFGDDLDTYEKDANAFLDMYHEWQQDCEERRMLK